MSNDYYSSCESVEAMLQALSEDKQIWVFTGNENNPIPWDLMVSQFGDNGFLCYRYPGNGTIKYLKVDKDNLRSLCEQSVRLRPFWDMGVENREKEWELKKNSAIGVVKSLLAKS